MLIPYKGDGLKVYVCMYGIDHIDWSIWTNLWPLPTVAQGGPPGNK